MCAVHCVPLSFGDKNNVYEKRAMKNRCCASSFHFLCKQFPFFSKVLKKCCIRGLCLVSCGGKKVAVLVVITIQNATENEIFTLLFVLVLQLEGVKPFFSFNKKGNCELTLKICLCCVSLLCC